MGVSAATMMMASSVVSAAGQYQQIQYQKAANAREKTRYERESKMAQIEAIEQENLRRDMLNTTLANNIAFQAGSGYYDDSRSFLNINKQARIKGAKDIKNIKLMGLSVQQKYRDQMFENDIAMKSNVFGGYTSIIAGLTTGYADYKWNKTPKIPKIKSGDVRIHGGRE